MSRRDVLNTAIQRLAAAGVDTPDRDARVLLMDAERIDSATLFAHLDDEMAHLDVFEASLKRRVGREPVSKILGYRDFWTHRFCVTPDVLDPRADTETLIEAALEIVDETVPLRILDLGTGSGCILLSLLKEIPKSTGVGVDQSRAALDVARANASDLNLTDRVDFLVSNWLERVDEPFDLVVCNPPYISTTARQALSPEVTDWDPETALFAGMDGLQAYREITSGLATVLKPNGTAFFEIGIGQAHSVSDLLKNAGFRRISSRYDLGGLERCLIVQR